MSDWVSFLVRDLDPYLLEDIRLQAEREERSISDVIRSVLCEHYRLKCPPSGRSTRVEFGAQTIRLRMHPKLWNKIRTQSLRRNVSMQRLVHDALEARYPQKEAVA